jgi:two-component system, response regulator YesN
MYSILIVDDEDPVLDSYTYMVQNSDLDLTVCGTARSGDEALSLAHAQHPDIVIMDIAMPGIDGLDTIKELQKAHPETLYILSTAYERFDLAQRAIPLRVFAYLVKPVSRMRFLDTLRNATDELEERRDELSHRLEHVQSSTEVLAREQREFLLFITWKALTEEHWERYQRLFRFSSDYGRVVVAQFDRLPATVSLDEAMTRISQRLERRFRSLSTEYLGRLVIFVVDSGDASELERYVGETVRAVFPRGSGIRIGIGARYRYGEFYLSYEHALAHIADPGPDSGGDYEDDVFFLPFRYEVARARMIDDVQQQCVAVGDREFGRLRFPAARARMIMLFSLLLEDLAARAGRDQAELLVKRVGDPALVIGEIETRGEWDAWSGRALRLIVEYGGGDSRDRLPRPLQKAIAHIETHFQSAIQLSEVAAECEVSVGYLCRLFADHRNTTFNDFLNSTRIAAAERYLNENTLSIKEIAFATGFRDPNYFSRIFKKYKGLSPTSYTTRREAHAE